MANKNLNKIIKGNCIEELKKLPEKPLIDKKIELEIDKWKKFELNGLFKIQGSKTTPLLELEEYGKGKYPYVTTQATNNGIEGFFDFYSDHFLILRVFNLCLI